LQPNRSLDKIDSPATEGHSVVTARGSSQDRRWIRAKAAWPVIPETVDIETEVAGETMDCFELDASVALTAFERSWLAQPTPSGHVIDVMVQQPGRSLNRT